jgi:hypothetical protein
MFRVRLNGRLAKADSEITPPSEFADHAIYLYRRDSWILKHKVRNCILALAQDRNWIVPPLEGGLDATINGGSLFELIGTECLVFCDIGEHSERQLQSDDVEGSLCAMAEARRKKRVFLMVPSDHAIVCTDVWARAISASHVAYIEEPLVTRANFAAIMESFVFITDLSKLGQLARTRAFRDHFSRFIPKRGCTVSDISMEIDRFVLLRMAEAPSQKPDRSLVVHRQTIDIALRGFLDRRDEATLRKVLVHVDRLLFTDMLDRSEVIARLYSTTASIVAGRDRRYKSRERMRASVPQKASRRSRCPDPIWETTLRQ